MPTLTDLMRERVLLLDGGMGTQILANNPTVEDFGGRLTDGCMELLNERRPEWIRTIHGNYFDAGADAVETNTFGANEVVLGEFGLAHRTREMNAIGARLAREVARHYDAPKFVIGSAGPGTKLLSLGQIEVAALYHSYYQQMLGLLEGGCDAILIETCQDLGQMKTAARAAKAAMAELKINIPIWVQATVETTGTLLVGTDIASVLTTMERLGISVLGMNCATGPDEMHAHLAHLAENSPLPISCLPNAGLPANVGGQVVYPLGPEAFAERVIHAAKEFGLNIIGGCCGTTPAHIKVLAGRMGELHARPRQGNPERSVSSLYQSVALHQEPAPLIVGERTNANGSKKFRDLLALEDYDGLVGIARDQQREGAHMLDVCTAYVGRDEVRDMEQFLRRAITQTTLPLMIDSTEVNVIERALQLAPGKCVVNSINFEDGEGKARKILDLCREYGAAVVALTIDETGMAKTCGQKVAVAGRLHDLVVGEYGFQPSDLIIDPLTFTLGSGDEAFRRSAVETLDAIRGIKASFPGVLTILGVSNVSFGLNPGTRHVLNALMLYHAVQAGLDLAIFNSSKVLPVAKIPLDERRMVEDLIFDRRAENYDPLKKVMATFSAGREVMTSKVDSTHLSTEARLQADIIDGEKGAILGHVDDALLAFEPLHIINQVLLPAMKIVGDRFGAGEMQLPFVLESAEAMKAAIARIEPHLPKDAHAKKGRILLATVKGDVHDIGKNLVDIILTNNGFEVKNLGIKQPIEDILKALEAWPADAIGLSGLLVKSTVVMRENLVLMQEQKHRIPVILGGAALTRDYVEKDCRSVYGGPVLYAADAFEGLTQLRAISEGRVKDLMATAAASPAEASGIKVLRKGGSSVPLTPEGQSSWVRREPEPPTPPFWGLREVGHPLPELFDFLDEFALLRNRWGFTQGLLSNEAFEATLRDRAVPVLARWKARLLGEGVLRPRASYGYFPACSRGDALLVYAPDTDPAGPPDQRRIAAVLPFPRQATGRRLCIADFFLPETSGKLDVLALQVVTLGQEAADFAAELYKADAYSDYFYFHGLATELTEAYAERLHAQVRRELGVHHRDSENRRQLFSQG
ncbi:MAG: methionine synthase, partial [Acidobacteriota bacterium]|nr:methionine synthase [Acidobacteriota bacterium]